MNGTGLQRAKDDRSQPCFIFYGVTQPGEPSYLDKACVPILYTNLSSIDAAASLP